MIIVVTGMPASGKSVFAELARNRGYEIFDLSSSLKDKIVSEGGNVDSGSLSSLAIKLRKENGKSAVAELALPKIRGKEKLVVSGLRNIEEFEFLREKLSQKPFLVAIKADSEKRLKRTLKGRKYGIKSEKDFRERDRKDRELGVEECIANADYTIENSGSLKEFRARIEEFLDEIEG